MKNPSAQKTGIAFTLVELLFVIGVLAAIAAFLYPSFVTAKQKAQRISCTGRLKQIGLGFRIWAGDHTNLYPMQIAMEFGGTKEFIASGATYRHLEIMSNELNTPIILACPSDKTRIAARSFTPALSNSNLSYFVGIDAADTGPNRFLAGDRNILGGINIGANLMEFSRTNGVGWGRDLHNGQGNVGLADGSVQGFTSSTLRTAMMNTGMPTNRLAMP